MEGFCGLIVIETNAEVTVNTAEELNPPELAVMVVVPRDIVAAKPAELIVAIVLADELQFEPLVRSAVLPSAYLPMTTNCCEFP